MIRKLGGAAFGTLALATALFFGCKSTENPWSSASAGQLKVLVSFAPLACFAEAVGGADTVVKSLLSTTGPHEHEATAADAHLAAGADVFLMNGLGLDEFVASVAKNARNSKLKIVEVAEEAVPETARFKVEEAGHDHGKKDDKKSGETKAGKHDHGHDHGEWDPHAWLGIDQAILMVEKIRDTFKEADPTHAQGYEKRAAEFVQKLKKLHADGKEMLAANSNRQLIATHESLRYFCKSYNLDLVDSIMPQPGVEADAGKLAELTKLCMEKNVHVIAIEPQYKRNIPDTLARELDKKGHQMTVVEIDPLETAPAGSLNGEYYIEVMRKNLKTLADHLPRSAK